MVGREAEVPRRRIESDIAEKVSSAPPGLIFARRRRVFIGCRSMPPVRKKRSRRAKPADVPFRPSSPFPPQHQEKPGIESRMHPRPRYEAPGYRGSGKLAGRVALVTGGDSGIGRAVAVLYAREGADVAIVFLREEQSDAEETRCAVEAEGARCLLIPGDVRGSAFSEKAVRRTVDEFGRLDILVNNAAFQQHQQRIEDLTDDQIT